MNVTVEREVDVAFRERRQELRRFVAVGKRAVANTDGIDGWNVHEDDVRAISPLVDPSCQPIVNHRIERRAPGVDERELNPSVEEAKAASSEVGLKRHAIIGSELVVTERRE